MDVLDRIQQQVDAYPVIVYMKGTPQLPQCGFSSRTAEALKSLGIEFAYVNVLADPEIEKNGTFASPATAFARRVLPVPGGPVSKTPFGAEIPSL